MCRQEDARKSGRQCASPRSLRTRICPAERTGRDACTSYESSGVRPRRAVIGPSRERERRKSKKVSPERLRQTQSRPWMVSLVAGPLPRPPPRQRRVRHLRRHRERLQREPAAPLLPQELSHLVRGPSPSCHRSTSRRASDRQRATASRKVGCAGEIPRARGGRLPRATSTMDGCRSTIRPRNARRGPSRSAARTGSSPAATRAAAARRSSTQSSPPAREPASSPSRISPTCAPASGARLPRRSANLPRAVGSPRAADRATRHHAAALVARARVASGALGRTDTLKNGARIEAFFFVELLALLVRGPIECELRRAMGREGVSTCPSIPRSAERAGRRPSRSCARSPTSHVTWTPSTTTSAPSSPGSPPRRAACSHSSASPRRPSGRKVESRATRRKPADDVRSTGPGTGRRRSCRSSRSDVTLCMDHWLNADAPIALDRYDAPDSPTLVTGSIRQSAPETTQRHPVA